MRRRVRVCACVPAVYPSFPLQSVFCVVTFAPSVLSIFVPVLYVSPYSSVVALFGEQLCIFSQNDPLVTIRMKNNWLDYQRVITFYNFFFITCLVCIYIKL